MKRLAACLALALLFSAPCEAQVSSSPDLSPLVTALQNALGATTGNGHTTAPVTLAFTTVAVGGTTLSVAGVTDPKSGIAPGVGAICQFGTNTTTALPATMLMSCVVTAPGTVAITAVPRAGIALGAQNLTGNVFWWW